MEVDGHKIPFVFSRPQLAETLEIPDMMLPTPSGDLATLASPWYAETSSSSPCALVRVYSRGCKNGLMYVFLTDRSLPVPICSFIAHPPKETG